LRQIVNVSANVSKCVTLASRFKVHRRDVKFLANYSYS